MWLLGGATVDYLWNYKAGDHVLVEEVEEVG